MTKSDRLIRVAEYTKELEITDKFSEERQVFFGIRLQIEIKDFENRRINYRKGGRGTGWKEKLNVTFTNDRLVRCVPM